MPLPAPAGVLLDLDGTLVDTVPARVEAWVAALARWGIATDADTIAPLIGSDGAQIARQVAEDQGIPMRRDRAAEIDRLHDEIFHRINTAPVVLPGVRELIAALDSAGVPWAIATSSSPQAAATSIRALHLDADPIMTDGSHVEHAKPAPDLFLLGAERIGVTADEHCWAVGDATWDMAAAQAAGMTAVGVLAGSAVNLPRLRLAGAHRVVRDLAEVTALVASAG